MFKNITQSLVFVLLVFFASCEEDYTTKSEKLEKVDFKKYKTYAWLPEIDSITVRGIDHYQLKNAILDNIDLQLLNRGLTVDTAKPDILFRYTIMLNNTNVMVGTPIYQNQTSVSYGVGMSSYGGYGSVGVYNQPVQVGTAYQNVPYRNGQLVIEMFELSSQKMVWRGYAYGSRVEDNQNAISTEMRKRAHKIINDIFWNFPIRKK